MSGRNESNLLIVLFQSNTLERFVNLIPTGQAKIKSWVVFNIPYFHSLKEKLLIFVFGFVTIVCLY
jgi:hypothetical protein